MTPRLSPAIGVDADRSAEIPEDGSVLPTSRPLSSRRRLHYGSAGPREEGLVMVVSVELDGSRFLALDGGPEFTFSEAVSFEVECADQAEVDRYGRPSPRAARRGRADG